MVVKAEESKQIKKARKKLAKQLAAEEKFVNEKTIGQMKKAIQIWINRHQGERVQLSERPVALFDENKHSVKSKSKYVHGLVQKLKGEKAEDTKAKPLAGRIKK